jgi:hypothetical protein
MSNTQHHRGAHPQDKELFTIKTQSILLNACEEAMYLLDRGYKQDTVLNVVSQHHELRVRQRTALQRSICTTDQARSRRAREIPATSLCQSNLLIDGFNLIITIEVALSGGLLLRGIDGAYRDLAGLRGSYHTVDETETALKLIGNTFDELQIASVCFYLDQPVSNSGRLKQLILENAPKWHTVTDVKLARNPDRELFDKGYVISSDSLVLDHAKSWINFTEFLIRCKLTNTWVLDFYSKDNSAKF